MSSLSLRNPWIRLLRPVQWSKNGVVFAALVFGRPDGVEPVVATIVATIAFCLVSSSTYIANDLADIDRDRHHPTKRSRPLPSGAIRPGVAKNLAVLFMAIALGLSLLVTPWLTLVLAVYATLMLLYTNWLKQMVIVDVFVIAGGFILRAIAGGVAVSVPLSSWLLLCTMLLALFLGFCKRRNELMLLDRDAELHRVSLRGYTVQILDQFILMTATCSIMAYAIYSFSSPSVPANGAMMATVPFVVFAMMRYLQLVYVRHEGGTPEMLLVKDRPLLAAILGWGAAVLVVLALW